MILFTVLLFLLCMAFILPTSYVIYLALPYTDMRPAHILPAREKNILRLIGWYPMVSLLLMYAGASITHAIGGPYMFSSMTGGIIFSAAHALLCLAAAAIGRSVYSRSWVGMLLFILNSICAGIYGIVCFAMINGD